MAPHSEPSTSEVVDSGMTASASGLEKPKEAPAHPNKPGVTSKGGFPRAPTFEDRYKERQYQKERLALAFRIFAKLGFDEGVAGHITLRVRPSLLCCYFLPSPVYCPFV